MTDTTINVLRRLIEAAERVCSYLDFESQPYLELVAALNAAEKRLAAADKAPAAPKLVPFRDVPEGALFTIRGDGYYSGRVYRKKGDGTSDGEWVGEQDPCELVTEMKLYIDRGDASAADVDEFLSALNALNIAHGGRGYEFVRELVPEPEPKKPDADAWRAVVKEMTASIACCDEPEGDALRALRDAVLHLHERVEKLEAGR